VSIAAEEDNAGGPEISRRRWLYTNKVFVSVFYFYLFIFQATLVDTLCADHGSTTIRRDNHHFFRLRNGELTGRGVQTEVCANGGDSVLAWIPYHTVLKNYAAELNPKERLTYIAKATNVEREKTELCHFRHTDLVNAVSDNLFTCVVMIFGDNFVSSSGRWFG